MAWIKVEDQKPPLTQSLTTWSEKGTRSNQIFWNGSSWLISIGGGSHTYTGPKVIAWWKEELIPDYNPNKVETEDQFIELLKSLYSKPMTKEDETTWRTVWQHRDDDTFFRKESDAVIGNKSVLYDKGWTARTQGKELIEAISEIDWRRGLTSLPPFTNVDKEHLIIYFTKGYNKADMAIKEK